MFIIKVKLAQDDVYGALDTYQQSRPNQIVYHNKIYPSIPGVGRRNESCRHKWILLGSLNGHF